MIEDLLVSIVQTDIVWENKKENFLAYSNLFDQNIKKTDLIILPEMFATGFTMNVIPLAETMEGETVNWMKNEASKHNSAICGSVIIIENEKFYNRLVWISSDGSLTFYDKKHLFSMGEEHKNFKPGKDILTCKIREWSIRPLICYDLRFPKWCRTDEKNHLTIFIASWPEQRIEHWETLLKARAIENQCFVIGVNRIGVDKALYNYNGKSQILDPYGNQIYFADNRFEMVTQNLKMEDLVKTRRLFPFLKDLD